MKAFTMAEITAGNLTAINGKVYDLNKYTTHPAGQSFIMKMMGTDATAYLMTAPHKDGILGVVSANIVGTLAA
jgi:cytochrome b involved in lipid metabolism